MAGFWDRVRSRGRDARRRPSRSEPAGPPGPPDFVGVGAQRAGTSWWFSLLLQHPGVDYGVERKKELHYFDRFADREFGAEDVARYHALFPRSGDLLRGEWTPRYMFDFWTPRLLARAAPEARILVMLRDPVERFSSGIAHEEALHGSQPWQRKLFAGSALARSRYAEQLDRLGDHFPRSQILVLQYERCLADPLAFYGKTLEFLGLAPFELEPSQVQRPVGRLTSRSPLPAEAHRAVVTELREDVNRLAAAFPEIDLSLWADFAPEGPSVSDQLTSGTHLS
ncbi:MAG: sulfotransferase family protein [Chloroflexota bacterium]